MTFILTIKQKSDAFPPTIPSKIVDSTKNNIKKIYA